MKVKKHDGLFQPGNTAAVGSRGPRRPDICTQSLISQLNELDKTSGAAKIHKLCEKLIELALGRRYTREMVDAKGRVVVDKNGKPKTIKVEDPPDLAAIREVIDRIQGRPPQGVEITAEVGPMVTELVGETLEQRAAAYEEFRAGGPATTQH